MTPAFSLNFNTENLDSRITFARALNTATRVNSSGFVESVAENNPRFDYDPLTLVSKGLLIEEQRTNYCLHSNDFSPSPAWVKSNGNFVANDAVSPDGTQNATKLIVTGWSPSIYTTITINSTSVAYSFYAKKGNSATVCNRFTVRNGTTAINLLSFTINYDTGAIAYSTGSSGVTATNCGNGWWRVSAVVTSGITSGNSCLFYAMTGSWAVNDFCYYYGAQVEYGAFATSYIPTNGTALTRNADVATITGTNLSDWWQAGRGGVLVRALPSIVSGTRPLVQFDDNTADNIIVLRGNTTNPELYIVDDGVAQAQLDAGTIAANTDYSMSAWWATNDCKARLNTGVAVTDLTATIPTVTQARIGSDGTNYLNGHIASIGYYDTFSGQIYTRRKNKAVFSLV